MKYDFECRNKECKECEKIIEKDIEYKDIDKQICKSCNEKLFHAWISSCSIRTGDGYKS